MSEIWIIAYNYSADNFDLNIGKHVSEWFEMNGKVPLSFACEEFAQKYIDENNLNARPLLFTV